MRKIFALLVAAGLVLSASLMGCSGCTSSSLFPVARSETVVQMIAGVQQAEVERLLRELTGESPIEVGGVTLTLTTRNTGNEAATRLATQFVFEFMQDRDIGVVYHDWADPEEGIAGRNVIAQMDGVDRPDEIVMITAHVDCMPDEGRAPGADDNASGSVGVMLAAAQLMGHTFERTIRFVLFTGEEYGPSGSQAYVAACSTRGENILGVLNLDCIGWDDNNDGLVFLQTSNPVHVGIYRQDMDVANAFIAVIDEYGIDALHPRQEGNWSLEADTQSFWDEGYPAVLAIEDEKYESNPNWHEPTDTVATLNLAYCTNFIKAAAATAAHMAVPAS